jgi:hypothetical protein
MHRTLMIWHSLTETLIVQQWCNMYILFPTLLLLSLWFIIMRNSFKQYSGHFKHTSLKKFNGCIKMHIDNWTDTFPQISEGLRTHLLICQIKRIIVKSIQNAKNIMQNKCFILETPWQLVRKWTVPTERPPLRKQFSTPGSNDWNTYATIHKLFHFHCICCTMLLNKSRRSYLFVFGIVWQLNAVQNSLIPVNSHLTQGIFVSKSLNTAKSKYLYIITF